jgi:hypothetical protein
VRDVFVEVLLEVPVAELARLTHPTEDLFEAMRKAADDMCADAGGYLRTDRAPEVRVQEAKSLAQVDVTLFASRWAAVVPEGTL